MTASRYGMNLLGEVEECRLDELLASLRAFDDPKPACVFGVPQMDELINSSSIITVPPIIELSSKVTCFGESNLVHQAIATAVLSSNFPNGSYKVGKGGVVLVLDNDGCFDVSRQTYNLLLTLKRQQDPENSMTDDLIFSEAMMALQYIHVFRPESFQSLMATVRHMPEYLFNTLAQLDNHPSKDRAVELILVNNLDAFDWQIRRSIQTTQTTQQRTRHFNDEAKNQQNLLLTALRELQSECGGCPILISNCGLQSDPWKPHCTLRLYVSRKIVPKFPARIDVEEAFRERDLRQTAIDGHFVLRAFAKDNDHDVVQQVGRTVRYSTNGPGGSIAVEE